MVVVALLLANQTTVDVENQPKIIMENDIKNEVIGTEHYDEDDQSYNKNYDDPDNYKQTINRAAKNEEDKKRIQKEGWPLWN